MAHRYRITPQTVPNHLEPLIEAEWLEERGYFHRAMKVLFHIPLPDDFPVSQYFGDTNEVNQLLRDIQVSLEGGINDFLKASRALLNRFFNHRQMVANASSVPEESLFPDDDELTSLRNDLEPDSNGTYKWRNGKQRYLLGRLRLIMQKYVQEIEGVISVAERNEVFICYARSNSYWKDLVLTHLKPYENYFDDIKTWSDDKIKKGGDWDAEIKSALQRAKAAILLETPEFLASNYIHNDELPEIMKAEHDRGLVIMRFPISSSAVGITPLARFNAVWESDVLLQNLIDGGQRGKVDAILVSACKKVVSVVSSSFREKYGKDEM